MARSCGAALTAYLTPKGEPARLHCGLPVDHVAEQHLDWKTFPGVEIRWGITRFCETHGVPLDPGSRSCPAHVTEAHQRGNSPEAG